MAKDVTLNNENFKGISVIELELEDGSGTAKYRDIDEISAPEGGSGASGSVLFASGEFIPTGTSGEFTIEHGLGKVPNCFTIYAAELSEVPATGTSIFVCGRYVKTTDLMESQFSNYRAASSDLSSYGSPATSPAPEYGLIAINENTCTLNFYSGTKPQLDYTYKWEAVCWQ